MSPQGLPLGDLEIQRDGSRLVRLQVEIAEKPRKRATGLMGVRSLGELQGMVFLGPAPSRGPFHMKDVLIPLDIAFWDERGVIVEILHMEPCRSDPCPLYSPSREYLGAVETNLGLMESKGVRVGDTIKLRRRVAQGSLRTQPRFHFHWATNSSHRSGPQVPAA